MLKNRSNDVAREKRYAFGGCQMLWGMEQVAGSGKKELVVISAFQGEMRETFAWVILTLQQAQLQNGEQSSSWSE